MRCQSVLLDDVVPCFRRYITRCITNGAGMQKMWVAPALLPVIITCICAWTHVLFVNMGSVSCDVRNSAESLSAQRQSHFVRVSKLAAP